MACTAVSSPCRACLHSHVWLQGHPGRSHHWVRRHERGQCQGPQQLTAGLLGRAVDCLCILLQQARSILCLGSQECDKTNSRASTDASMKATEFMTCIMFILKVKCKTKLQPLQKRCAHHCLKCCSLLKLLLLSELDVPEGLLTTASNSSLLLMNSANASGCFFMQSCIAPKDFKQSDPCMQMSLTSLSISVDTCVRQHLATVQKLTDQSPIMMPLLSGQLQFDMRL